MDKTENRLGDRFREHYETLERNYKGASKPIPGLFNLPSQSTQHMKVFHGLSLLPYIGRYRLEQKFVFQIGSPLDPHGPMNTQLVYSCFLNVAVAQLFNTQTTYNPQFLDWL